MAPESNLGPRQQASFSEEAIGAKAAAEGIPSTQCILCPILDDDYALRLPGAHLRPMKAVGLTCWQARSGRTFLPIQCPESLDFTRLLQTSVGLESAQDVDGASAPPDALAHDIALELEPKASKAIQTLPTQQKYPAPSDDAKQPLSRSHAKRRRQREERAVERGQYPRPRVVEKYAQTSRAIATSLKVEALPATSCGYLAKNRDQARPWRGSAQRDSPGYTPWDG